MPILVRNQGRCHGKYADRLPVILLKKCIMFAMKHTHGIIIVVTVNTSG